MSEFSVHRTADRIPALRYCLVLDGERIAGGKPDYRGNNHLISWSTRETYGPVDQLKVENAKLRELVKRMHGHIKENCDTCDGWYCSNFDEDNECCVYDTLARELGVEVTP